MGGPLFWDSSTKCCPDLGCSPLAPLCPPPALSFWALCIITPLIMFPWSWQRVINNFVLFFEHCVGVWVCGCHNSSQCPKVVLINSIAGSLWTLFVFVRTGCLGEQTRICLCGTALPILLISQVMSSAVLLETQFSHPLLCNTPSHCRPLLSLWTAVTKTQLSLGHVGSQLYTALDALGTVVMVAVSFLRVTNMSGFCCLAGSSLLNSCLVDF